MSRSTRRRPPGGMMGAAGLVLLLMILVGCTSGGDDGVASGGAAEGSAGAPVQSERDALGVVDPLADNARRAGGSDFAAKGAKRAAVQTRAVIRRGELWLVSKDVPAARARIADVVGRYGGLVAQEQSFNGVRGRTARTTIVLRFPEPEFDTVMGELAEVARVKSATRSSEDVTTEVIDVDTRVATAEASLRRLQRFLRQATDIDAIIRLEAEIATRQAELESLKAQQEYLADQTALSTVTVHLTAAEQAVPPEPEDLGFLVGLAGGWEALRAVLLTAATIAGALVPFAVTLAIIGAPVWLLVRGLTRRGRAAASSAAASGSSASGSGADPEV
jgi:hypothetical protein